MNSGLLLLDKPSGKSSYGAVAAVKHLTHCKRVGHTGTLDPMATGVLPVFIGRPTALCGYLLDADKEYVATVKLGVTTDTGDITGTVLGESAVKCSQKEIGETIIRFLGETEQTPPSYSAIKKDGVRLYELARKGISVEIPKRKITVYELELLSDINENNEFEMRCLVSKGTYIRSLCADIGDALGCGATLSALRRTKTSGFDISECVRLEDLNEENINSYIISEETAVMQFEEIKVTENQAVRFLNGGQLSFDRLPKRPYADGEIFRIKHNGDFLGLGFADCAGGCIAIKCVIAEK